MHTKLIENDNLRSDYYAINRSNKFEYNKLNIYCREYAISTGSSGKYSKCGGEQK